MMNIYQKLLEVRKSVPYLKKDSKGFNYQYTSSSQVLSSVREKIDEMGLLLIPSVTGKNFYEKSTISGKEHLTELEMDFTWVNVDNPDERIVCSWYGQGADTGEKGVGKCLTYAEKYFILKFFNIPTDIDDPDAHQKPPTRKDQNRPEGPREAQGSQEVRQTRPQAQEGPEAPETDSSEPVAKEEIASAFNLAKSLKLTEDEVKGILKATIGKAETSGMTATQLNKWKAALIMKGKRKAQPPNAEQAG